MLVLAMALSGCSLEEGRSAGDCSDEADNDGDGLFDCSDDGCTTSPACDESDTEIDADTDADTDADSDTDSDADADTDTDTGVNPNEPGVLEVINRSGEVWDVLQLYPTGSGSCCDQLSGELEIGASLTIRELTPGDYYVAPAVHEDSICAKERVTIEPGQTTTEEIWELDEYWSQAFLQCD